jgi:hypothetical protein
MLPGVPDVVAVKNSAELRLVRNIGLFAASVLDAPLNLIGLPVMVISLNRATWPMCLVMPKVRLICEIMKFTK